MDGRHICLQRAWCFSDYLIGTAAADKKLIHVFNVMCFCMLRPVYSQLSIVRHLMSCLFLYTVICDEFELYLSESGLAVCLSK